MKLAPLAAGIMVLIAAPTFAAPAKAPAAAGGANRDVRCLLLANMYAKVAAAAQGKEAAAQARLFYLGRISGRLASVQLSSAMETAAKTIDPAKAGADMNACALTVQSTATSVEAAGAKVRAAVVAPPAAAGPAAPATGH